MLKKYFVILIFLSVTSFLSALFPVFAAVTCTTQYGGGQTCVTTGQLLINKKVYDPDQKAMLDNSAYNFAYGQEVIFSIEIKNVGDATLNNIKFSDILPTFLTLSEGKLTDTIDSLTPGQTRTFTVKAKVNSNGTGCALNTASATMDGVSDSDSAQVCIKGVIPKETPKAGAEGLIFLLPLGGIGYLLKRFSNFC